MTCLYFSKKEFAYLIFFSPIVYNLISLGIFSMHANIFLCYRKSFSVGWVVIV
jgi:hypothetical protein